MIRKLLHTIVETIEAVPAKSTEPMPFRWIANSTPCFPLSAGSIKILTKPEQFYSLLLQGSQDAKYRITLASLYLGTGELEKKIVDTLINNQSFKNNKLVINILLDYTRGSRCDSNSRTMLLPLLNENDQSCHISLYHTPQLHGLLKKCLLNPWNEVLGLQHMKIYIFDDTLIISGANLSNDYFTNRQDRYFVIEDKNLSNFYDGLVRKIQCFSLKLNKHNQIMLEENWDLLPYKQNTYEYIYKARAIITKYLQEMKEKYPTDPEAGK